MEVEAATQTFQARYGEAPTLAEIVVSVVVVIHGQHAFEN